MAAARLSFGWTFALLAGGLGLAGLSLWLARRPRQIGAIAFPSTMGLGIGVILVVVALAHLISLETGHTFTGRMRY